MSTRCDCFEVGTVVIYLNIPLLIVWPDEPLPKTFTDRCVPVYVIDLSGEDNSATHNPKSHVVNQAITQDSVNEGTIATDDRSMQTIINRTQNRTTNKGQKKLCKGIFPTK